MTPDRLAKQRRKQRRAAQLDALIADAASERGVSVERRREVARQLGIGDRQIRRLLANGGFRPRPRYTIGPEERAALWDARGNLALAAEVLGVNRRTLNTAVLLDASFGERAEMRLGDKERRKFELRVQQTYEFGEVWELDFKDMSTPARHPDDDRVITPRVGHVKCTVAKPIVGHLACPDTENGEDTAELIRRAVMLREEEGVFAGRPTFLRMDNASVNISPPVRDVLDEFGILPQYTAGYHPNHNGDVEAYHDWAERRFAAPTPLYAHAPQRIDKAPYLPRGLPPTWAAFCADYQQFVYDYNHSHRHSSLGGRTPAQAWQDATR